MTMFYGFFNHIYNRERDIVRVAGRGLDSARLGDYAGARRDFAMVLARSFYYVAVPALIEGMATQGSPNESKGEGWGSWALKAVGGELAAGIPLLRDIARSALDGREFEFTPLAREIETAIGTGRDAASAAGLTGKHPSKKWLQHAIETAGYVTGLPTGQAAESGQYVWNVLEGHEHSHGIGDLLHGLIFGQERRGKLHNR